MHRSLSRRVLALLALIGVCSLSLVVGSVAAQNGGNRYRVILPGIQITSSAPAPAPPTPPTPTPPATVADGAFFFEPTTKTASSSVVVDAQGGTHVAYYYAVSENEGGADVVYSYCPPPASECTTDANWQRVRLFGPVTSVQLQLTPDGKPRLLAENIGSRNSAYLHIFYTYAECDQSCLQAANWRSAEVDSVLMGYLPEPRETPRRFFALDRQGQPAFVATDHGSNVGNNPRYGSLLYRCATNCTDAANWTPTSFTPRNADTGRPGNLDNAVLRFTADNQPRVLGEYYPTVREDGYVTQITYFACDRTCDDAGNWSFAYVSPRGNGPKPAWDLELTAQNQPRAVVFHQETGTDREKRLFFFQCDTSCTDATGWSAVNLDLSQNIGLGADLALDSAGRPRIAHLASNGILVYSWCEQNCATPDSWLHGVVEKPETLDATNAVVIPSGCVAGIWDNYGVRLALDPQGNPRISYDATYQAQCAHNPKPGQPPTAGFYEIAHLIRLSFSPKP